MKKLASAILMILCLPVSAPAATYTMQGAISRALEANPTIEEKLKALEAAKMNIGVAQSFFWPRVSLVYTTSNLQNSGNVGSTDELSSVNEAYGLRLTMSLFAGFSHLTTLQQSIIRKEISEWTKRQAENELVANVKIQYFTLLQARRNLRLAKESINRIQTQLKAAEAFAAEDLVPYGNVLQNRVELARGKEQLIQAENALETAKIQLNRYMGLDPDAKTEFRGELEDYPRYGKHDRNASIELALKQRPDVVIAQKTVAAARKQMLATAGQALPQVDLTYDNMRQSKDYDSSRYRDYDRNYWSVGLNFTWNFFEGGHTAFSTLSQKNTGESLYAAYKNTVAGAKNDVIKSIMDIDSALKVYETAKEGTVSATESYAQARHRYDNGIGTITELLDTQTRLTEAEVRCSQAMAEYQIAHVRYLFHTGARDLK